MPSARFDRFGAAGVEFLLVLLARRLREFLEFLVGHLFGRRRGRFFSGRFFCPFCVFVAVRFRLRGCGGGGRFRGFGGRGGGRRSRDRAQAFDLHRRGRGSIVAL